MRCRVKRHWFLILSAASAASAEGAVFDVDDRVAEHGTPGELAAIGVVSGERGSHATAFLISACEALTVKHAAGHVATAIGRRMAFRRPGIDRRNHLGTVIAEGEHDLLNDWRGADRQGDWMLIRLDRCLARSTATARLSTAPIGWRSDPLTMQSAGFPAQRAWQDGITRDPACHIRMVQGAMVRHDCAALPGDSGGPLFALEGRGAQTVYAMQATADHWPGVQPWQANRANMAIATAAIVPHILPYLSQRTVEDTGPSRRAPGKGWSQWRGSPGIEGGQLHP
jgi:V8-like Glu-specific endopeptidase